MKKVLSLALVIAVLCVGMVIPASADGGFTFVTSGPVSKATQPTTLDPSSFAAGDEFRICISVENAQPVTLLQFGLQYDSDLLEITGKKDYKAINVAEYEDGPDEDPTFEANAMTITSETYEANPYTVTINNALCPDAKAPTLADGTVIFGVNFKVKAAAIGKEVEIKLVKYDESSSILAKLGTATEYPVTFDSTASKFTVGSTSAEPTADVTTATVDFGTPEANVDGLEAADFIDEETGNFVVRPAKVLDPVTGLNIGIPASEGYFAGWEVTSDASLEPVTYVVDEDTKASFAFPEKEAGVKATISKIAAKFVTPDNTILSTPKWQVGELGGYNVIRVLCAIDGTVFAGIQSEDIEDAGFVVSTQAKNPTIEAGFKKLQANFVATAIGENLAQCKAIKDCGFIGGGTQEAAFAVTFAVMDKDYQEDVHFYATPYVVLKDGSIVYGESADCVWEVK